MCSMNGGRILLMQSAFESVRTSMKYYVGAASPELLEGFVQVVDELKSCRLGDDAFTPLFSELDPVLSSKLHDLLLIRSAYDAQCAGRFIDPRDEMSRLADAVRELDWFSGRRVYIDGFSGFTPQEYAILSSLSRADVQVAIDFDPACPDAELFSKEKETVARLAKLIGNGHAETVALSPPVRYNDLAVLERDLFDYAVQPSEPVPQHIELTVASGIFSECEFAAARIVRLLRAGCAAGTLLLSPVTSTLTTCRLFRRLSVLACPTIRRKKPICASSLLRRWYYVPCESPYPGSGMRTYLHTSRPG